MPYYTNFFWATFFILYDPLEFSTGACPTPSGLEMAKTHHCVLLGHQIGSTSNIVLGEEGVRNSEKPTDIIYGRPLGMDSQLCFVVITLLLM